MTRPLDFLTAHTRRNPPGYDPVAEFNRLQAKVNELSRIVAALTPEVITNVIKIGLRPVEAELALIDRERERARGVNVHNSADDFAGYDMNAHMRDGAA